MYKSKFNPNKGKFQGNHRRQNGHRYNAYQSNSNSSNFKRLTRNESNSSNRSASSSSAVPILQYSPNADSELSKWIEQITPVLQSMFGHLASFITTDEYYVPVMPEPPDTPWTDANDPGRVNRLVLQAKTTEYAKSLTKLEDDKPRMWGEIEKYLSVESKAQIRLDATYPTLQANHNVLGYWRLIKQVHRTQAGKINVRSASLQALTNYYSIKQKGSESLNEYKDRLTAAIERIRSADSDEVPSDADQARKFTTSLDPRRFNRLIMDCELTETKYEATLASALQQASAEKILKGDILVPSDQMIPTGGNIAGAAVGDNGEFKVSRKERKMIMNFRRDTNKPNQSDNDDDANTRHSNGGGPKRGRDDNLVNYTNSKKQRYDKYSNGNRQNANNKNDKDRECVICKMNNHSTHECRHLSAVQATVAQTKSRNRYENTSSSSSNNNQANFSNQKMPILSSNPLTQALTTLRPQPNTTHRMVHFN